MAESRSLRNLRRAMYGLSAVPIVAGAAAFAIGADSISGAGAPSANVESELRFYGAWWIGAGLFLVWLAPRVHVRARELRVFCGLLALGALGRLLGALDEGWPDTEFVALMAVEVVVAGVLVAWQAHAGRTPERPRQDSNLGPAD